MSKLSFREVLETIQSHKPIEKYKRAPNHRRSHSRYLALNHDNALNPILQLCVKMQREKLYRERDGDKYEQLFDQFMFTDSLNRYCTVFKLFTLWWVWYQKPSFSVPESQRLPVYTMKLILDIWMLLETIKFLDINYQPSPPLTPPPLFYKVAIPLIISSECDILQKEDKVKFCIYGIFVDLMKFLSVTKW